MKKAKNIITPDQVIEIALRRRWYIILPFIASMIAGIFYTTTLSKIYEAKTMILIQGQKVPENYVQAIVDSDLNSRISTLHQQIMSRTNLERIINEFRLFEDPMYENTFMEEKIDRIRNNIKINIINDRREALAFSITYQGSTPEKVMKIANELATYFIDENLKARESQAFGTSHFLQEQLNDKRLKLEEVEETLKQYRSRYMGELPEQLETNLRILDRLQEQLNDRQQVLREEKARLLVIENQIQNAQEQGMTSNAVAGVAPTLLSELDQLKHQLAELKIRYTARHPDVLNLEKKIIELESNQAGADTVQEQDIQTDQAEMEMVANPLIVEHMQQRVEIKRDIQILEVEIADNTSQIKYFQERVENTPKREQELLSLRRDYQNIQTSYNSLLSRKLESDISVDMEKKQKGEQFRIIDRARLPEKPINADMEKLFLLFIGAGLGIGGGIIFLLEYLDTSFRKPEDLENLLELPVLCMVPKLIYTREKRMGMFNQVFSIFFTGVSLALLAGFAVLTFKGVDRTIAFIRRFVDL